MFYPADTLLLCFHRQQSSLFIVSAIILQCLKEYFFNTCHFASFPLFRDFSTTSTKSVLMSILQFSGSHASWRYVLNYLFYLPGPSFFTLCAVLHLSIVMLFAFLLKFLSLSSVALSFRAVSMVLIPFLISWTIFLTFVGALRKLFVAFLAETL